MSARLIFSINASRRELPAFLKQMLANPPKHGDGLHRFLFCCARHLHPHMTDSEIVALLASIVTNCGRPVPLAEIRAAVADSKKCAWGNSLPLARSSAAQSLRRDIAKPWPDLDESARSRVLADSASMPGSGVETLRSQSPVSCSCEDLDAEAMIDALFPGNPLLCTGRTPMDFRTEAREHFRGQLANYALIVPSPMSARMGTRKSDGKPSAHTLNNTGPRHYLVTEFDTGTADEQATLICHLRQFAPLVAVVSSASKSLHAWWPCRDVAEAALLRFFRYAVTLGADRTSWTRSQFARLPQGWRADKGRRQEVHYFNPEAVEGAAE